MFYVNNIVVFTVLYRFGQKSRKKDSSGNTSFLLQNLLFWAKKGINFNTLK